jgi:hypothetical protein
MRKGYKKCSSSKFLTFVVDVSRRKNENIPIRAYINIKIYKKIRSQDNITVKKLAWSPQAACWGQRPGR